MKGGLLAPAVAAAWLATCWSIAAPAAAPARPVDWNAAGDRVVELLSRYIRLDTSNPPGDVVAAGRFLQEVLEEAGIETRWLESEPGVTGNLVARLPAAGPPAGKPLMLLHHMDVVPADPSRWERDPFAGQVEAGRIWGRGAVDMKGFGVLHLMTLLLLKEQEVPLERDVVLLASADEEVGGTRGVQWLQAHHPEVLDVAWVLDEGGFGALDVVADGRLVFNISVVEKRIVWLRLTARGVAGHGSQPHPDNPNDRLVAALARVLAMKAPGDPPPVVREMRQRVGALAANKFTHAITHTTTSLTSLTSGVGDPPKINVIPSVATATLDNRLLPGVSPADFVEAVRQAVADPSITIEVAYQSGETPVTPWDSDLFRVLEATLKRHHPGAVVTPASVPFGTDSNTLRQQGVGAYGFLPVVLSLEAVSSMHGDAEHMPVEALKAGVRVFYEAVRDFAGRPPAGAP